MIRVIHLSDLHIHKSGKKADNQNAKAIVDCVCGDHIVDRGDLGEGEEEIKRLLTSGRGFGRVQVSSADLPLRSEKLAVFT